MVVGLKDREILLSEMEVAMLATVEGEEKRKVRIVGVEQIERTQVEGVVAGNRREEGVQEVVFLFIELGVVNAENFIEVGACPVHLCQVQVVNHDGEGELAKVVSVQLDLLDAFSEFPDLGFLGIVEQHVLRGRVVHADLARERALGVVKMAALGLNDPAHLAGIFLFPLGHHVIVGFHFKQAFEDEREALGGRLLERQNLDVVIVYPQMPAMAFQVRFREVVIEEGVVFELGEFELVGMEVERSFENTEGFVFVEHPDREEVADLEDEAAGFLNERCLGVDDMLPKNDGLPLGGELRPQICKGLPWILGELGERGFKLLGNLKPLVQHHIIDGQGKESVGLAAEVGDAVFDRSVHDRVGIELVGDGLVVALEEVLVDAIIFVEQLQG